MELYTVLREVKASDLSAAEAIKRLDGTSLYTALALVAVVLVPAWTWQERCGSSSWSCSSCRGRSFLRLLRTGRGTRCTKLLPQSRPRLDARHLALTVGRVAPTPGRILVIGITMRNPASRGNAVVEFQWQVRIVPRTISQALAVIVGVTAKHPVALLNTQRRGAVIEAGAAEVSQRVISDHVGTPGKIAAFIEHHPNSLAPVATSGRVWWRTPSTQLPS